MSRKTQRPRKMTRIDLRVSVEDKRQFMKAARRSGVTLSTWLRLAAQIAQRASERGAEGR